MSFEYLVNLLNLLLDFFNNFIISDIQAHRSSFHTNRFFQVHSFYWSDSVMLVFLVAAPPKMRILWQWSRICSCLQFCTTRFSPLTLSKLIMFCRMLFCIKDFKILLLAQNAKQAFFGIFNIFVIIHNFVGPFFGRWYFFFKGLPLIFFNVFFNNCNFFNYSLCDRIKLVT